MSVLTAPPPMIPYSSAVRTVWATFAAFKSAYAEKKTYNTSHGYSHNNTGAKRRLCDKSLGCTDLAWYTARPGAVPSNTIPDEKQRMICSVKGLSTQTMYNDDKTIHRFASTRATLAPSRVAKSTFIRNARD